MIVTHALSLLNYSPIDQGFSLKLQSLKIKLYRQIIWKLNLLNSYQILGANFLQGVPGGSMDLRYSKINQENLVQYNGDIDKTGDFNKASHPPKIAMKA